MVSFILCAGALNSFIIMLKLFINGCVIVKISDTVYLYNILLLGDMVGFSKTGHI